MSFSEWKTVKIEDVAEVVSGGTPSTKREEYYGGEIPWITPKDLSGYNLKYISNGERNITKAGLENSSAKLLPKGTILFSSRAPIGYVAIADCELATNQGFKNLICNPELVDNHFMYYKLKTLKESFESIAGGSTFKEVSGKLVKQFEIFLPPLTEQRKIANLLSAIDNKIELNYELNKTLEEMAETIYKRWFIDFEFPNEQNQPYKFSGGQFVDSESGMIPVGWECRTLESVSELANTGADAIRRAPIVDYNTGIRCARVGDLSQNRDVSKWGFCEVSKADFGKFSLKKNDILITRTATIGLNTFILEDIDAVFNNGLIRIRIKDDYNPLFIYQVLNYKDYYNYINRITGETSTRPNMKINYLLNYSFVMPKPDIITKFTELINPLISILNNNNKENEKLGQVRESLITKLLSGEIRISDAEKEVEECLQKSN